MVIIGLTGSIGTGKSTTGKMFAARGIPVYDADAAVHALYEGGAAVEKIEKRFPGVTRDGAIDRQKLSAKVLGNLDELRDLESIVHPLVHEVEQEFLKTAFATGRRFVVLEIPLLLESGGEARCDLVVTTLVANEIQTKRVLARDGMSREKFEKIHAKQIPRQEKIARSHFLVDTGKGMAAAERQVGDILRAIQPMTGRKYLERRQEYKNRPGEN